MAQSSEYLTVIDDSASSFVTTLATKDDEGWEVVGYALDVEGSSFIQSALLRRRICE